MSHPKALSVPLLEICHITWGNTSITKRSYTPTGFPAFSATGNDGFLPDFDYDHPAIVLSAIGARCGKCFLATGKWSAIKNTIVIWPKDPHQTDLHYLFLFLNREEIWPRDAMAQPFITMGRAGNVRVPHPRVELQRRIAARLREQLAEVQKARAAVQAQVAAAKALFPAHLRALFDGPDARHWPRCKLQDVAILQRGRFSPRPRNNPVFYGGKYPFIQTGDVESPDGFIHTHTQTLNDRGLAVSKLFPKGTLVISIAANIGIVGVLTFDSCMPDSLVGIQGKDGVADNRFLYFLLNYLRPHLQALAPHMAQANLSLALLGPTDIPLPDATTQKHLAAELDATLEVHLQHLDTLRHRLAALDHLPAALLREAFSGKL